MPDRPRMSLEEALRVAEQVSPLPSVAHDALQVLVAEVRRLGGIPAHYEDYKHGIHGFDAGIEVGGTRHFQIGRGAVFGGMVFITDPTLGEDEIAVVDGNRRTVFKLDLGRETAIPVSTEPAR